MASPGGGSWADYWASLSDVQEYYNQPKDALQRQNNAPSAPPPVNPGQSQYWNPYTKQFQTGVPTSQAGQQGMTPGQFVPTFQTGLGVSGPDPSNPSQPLNPFYYASPETANYMAQLLGAKVVQSPSDATGGGYTPGLQAGGSPFSFPGAAMLQLPNGQMINAGTLAQSLGFANASTPQTINQNLMNQFGAGNFTPLNIPQGAAPTPSVNVPNVPFSFGGAEPPSSPFSPVGLGRTGTPGLDRTGGMANTGGVRDAGSTQTYPTPGTPPVGVGIQPPPGPTGGGGAGFNPGTNRIPPPVPSPVGGPPPSLGGVGGGNPGSTGGNFVGGVPKWDIAAATPNPFTRGAGAGGTPTATGGIPTDTRTAGGSPFSPGGGGGDIAMGQMLAGGMPQGGGADSWMSNLAQGSTDALQSIIGGKGNPIDQTPAWDAMVKAQQRNIGEGQARLNAQFDVSGNRFSSAFGTASTDYQNQAVLDQNALLAQMTSQAGEGAQGRLLNAGSTMAGLGAGAASQLSGQDFQSIMQQYGISADMAKYMAGGADTAASQLAGLGAAGSNALYGGSMAGANALFGGENQAAQSMYGGQNSTLPAFMNYLMGSQQQGLGAASDLSQLWNANLQTGAGIGQQQYTDQQSAINNAYQEWLRTQPTNNPLLSMMFSGATGYPQMYNPSYQPGVLGSLLGTVGQIGGALAGRQ